jgi:UDP-N-acetylmuramate: L-alanyl-gamma-D-glutamyl-meso-diaminopimelate ligase
MLNEDSRHIHFIGVCGTAMGSVAAAMKRRGYIITGSDAGIYPPMSDFLAAEGVEMFEGFRAENIPEDTNLVVVGNAISRGNEELESVLERKLLFTSLPEVLKHFFLQGKRNLVVTGTHGKTTTSSMLAWILKHAGRDPSYMIGGLPKNLGQGAVFTESEFTVLEGDEYDTAFFDKRSKFHHYLPETVVINNIEFDHADIFNNIDEIKLSFSRMLRLVPRNGKVFYNGDDANCRDVACDAPAPTASVGFGAGCGIRIENVSYLPGRSEFTLEGERYVVPMDGEFNVRNAAMAASAARFAGLSAEEVRAALEGFGGVTRRQELRGEEGGVKVIDDFGHHPSAIRLAVAAIRQHYPEARLWAVFEPRSNTTRRKVFQNELAEALASADGALVSAVPNAEKVAADDRLNPELLMETIRAAGVPAHYEVNADAIVTRLVPLTQPGDVIVVFSNGGFDGIHGKLLAALASNGGAT